MATQPCILIADDEEINREIYRALLKDNYTLIFASDGYDALTAFEDFIKTINLVILDINMPRANGFEICEFIHLKYPNHAPILMSSSLSYEDNYEKCLKIGASDYITKPFIPEILLQTITETLHTK